MQAGDWGGLFVLRFTWLWNERIDASCAKQQNSLHCTDITQSSEREQFAMLHA